MTADSPAGAPVPGRGAPGGSGNGIIRNLIATLADDDSAPPPRAGMDDASLLLRFPHLDDVVIVEHVVVGPHGPLPARLYQPRAGHRSAALVWVHGGGYVLGGLDSPEAHWFSWELAARGLTVFSIDYHLARSGVAFPIPLDDVEAGWEQGARVLSGMGFEGSAIHLGGGSAGANLAVCAILKNRHAPRSDPASLALLYPLAHRRLPRFASSSASPDLSTGPHYGFTPDDVAAMSDKFAPARDGRAPRFAFAGDERFVGFPPTLIVNAELDTLRASGEALATRMRRDGVAVTVECQRGIGHGHVDAPGTAGTIETIDRFRRWLDPAQTADRS